MAEAGELTIMGHAFHELYYHFAWSTHAREPHIHPSYRPELLRIINDEVNERGGWPIRHNAMFDHVHLLVRLPPTVWISDLIGQLKGAAAYRVNREVKPKFRLRWQDGYGALTVRKGESLRPALPMERGRPTGARIRGRKRFEPFH